ncbi:hypothetical protein AMELA_G00025040 [Ameiurus melas]|uniref:Uncharacterized protein n=1 Tax=Ameiurus melas TaxID=219545 RepID=A0A7J6BCK4_AMEME|nr:hypothetical protein AMELA_G00025040 [Ameiurus melas]
MVNAPINAFKSIKFHHQICSLSCTFGRWHATQSYLIQPRIQFGMTLHLRGTYPELPCRRGRHLPSSAAGVSPFRSHDAGGSAQRSRAAGGGAFRSRAAGVGAQRSSDAGSGAQRSRAHLLANRDCLLLQ